MSIIYRTPVTEEQQKAVVTAQQNKVALDEIRAAIKTESNTRANDDIEINRNISALRGVVTEEINARASETAILTADLATEINQRETAVFNLRNDLSAEILARETSESNIQDDYTAKIDAEKTARSQALADMQAAILAAMGNDKAAESIENDKLREQIEAEAANQAAGLKAISDKLATEEGTRAAEDTKLSNAIADETAARKTADLQLQNTFNTAISTETNARVACDTALSTALTNAINTEIQARNDAIDSASKVTKAYVDQQVAAVEGNLNVFTAPTATQNGKSGIVPPVPAGMFNGILTPRGWRTPEDASLTISIVPTQAGTLTYTSNTTQTPTWTNFDNKKLKIEGELSGVDAKTYTVKFTPIDMYMWSDTLDQQPKTATWKIEPRLLTKPSASVREFTFAANTTHGLNVSNFDAVYESQTGTISASNVNTYTAVYKLRSPANTRWNDGSVADVEISWKIKPLQLPKPSAAVTEFDCDENVKNLDVANLNSTYIRKKSGTTSESEPGNYSVVYELIDKSNTQWNDSSTADVTINWKINLRVLTLEQSSGFAQVGTLTYNGNSQSVTVKNFDAKYHVLGSDTAKVDAGTYTATVTPRVGCVWNDMTKTAKTVSWTIQPKTLAIPYADVTAFEYDGAAKTLQVKNYDPATMTQNGTVSTAEAGEYSVKYILKSKSNYKWADNSVTDKVIEWNVGSKELPKPSCATTQFTYSGDRKTITVLNVDTNYMTETGTKSEVNAGEYQVVYHLTNTLRAKWADGSVEDVVITWKIDRKKLTATQSNISKTGDFTYDGYNKYIKNNLTNIDENYHDLTGDISGREAGDFTVTVAPKSNYCWSSGTFEPKTFNWKIEVRKLEKPYANVTVFEWDGNYKTLEVFNYDSTYISQSNLPRYAAVGEYTVKYSLNSKTSSAWSDNSTDDIVINWRIERKKLSPELSTFAQDAVLIYSGSNYLISDHLSGYNSSYHNLSGDQSKYAAGTYTVKVTPKTNYAFSDGTYEAREVQWTIQPLSVDMPVADNTDFVYDGKSHAPTVTGYNTSYMTRSGDYGNKTALGNYKITYTLKNTTNTRWVDGSVEPYVINWSIGLTKVPIPFVTDENFAFTYDGNGHFPAFENWDSDKMKFKADDEDTPMTLAGVYFVTVVLKDTTQYVWEDGSNGEQIIYWRINPKPLTAAQSTGFAQSGTLNYNGQNQTVSITNFDANYHQLSTQYIATNAGTYVAKITPRMNYCWNNGSRTAIPVVWTIDPLKLVKPSASGTTDFEYDKQAHSLSVQNFNDTYMTQKGDATTQTNTGFYNTVYSLKSTANTTWDDDSVADVPVSWSISKKQIPRPLFTVNNSNFYTSAYNRAQYFLAVKNYNANYMSFEITTTPDGFTTNPAGATSKGASFSYSGIGLYVNTYTLTDDTVEWDDPSLGAAVTLSVNITSAKLSTELSNPYQKNLPTYTGRIIRIVTEQGVGGATGDYLENADTNFQTWSGETSASTVGEHTAYVEPGENYTWQDGTRTKKTVKWRIDPAPIDKPTFDSSVTLTYDGNSKSPTLSGYDKNKMTLGGDVSAINAGVYTITVTPTENYVWAEDGSRDTVEIQWQIDYQVLPTLTWNQDISKYVRYSGSLEVAPTFDGTTIYIFESDNSKLAARVKNYDSDTMTISGTFSASETGKTYLITFTPKNANHSFNAKRKQNGILRWSIRPATLNVPTLKSNGILSYTGEAQSPFDSTINANLITVTGDATGTAKKSYSTTLALKYPAHSTWQLSDGTKTTENQSYRWSIGVTAVGSTPSLAQAYFDYGGTKTVTINGFDSATMTKTGTESASKRGFYTITFKLKDTTGTCWSTGGSADIVIEWAIGTKKIAKPTLAENAATEFDYSGAAKTLQIAGYDANTMQMTGYLSATDAGSYTVSFTPRTDTGVTYVWQDGTSSAVTFTWKINRKTLSVNAANFPDTYSVTYKGRDVSPYFAAYDASTMALSSDTAKTNVGTYTIKISPKANYCWSDGTFSALSCRWSVTPQRISIPTATKTVYEHTGEEITLEVSNFNTDFVELVSTSKMTATASGSYTATFKLKDSINNCWKDETTANKSISWSIGAAYYEIPTISPTTQQFALPTVTYSVTPSDYDSNAISAAGLSKTFVHTDFNTSTNKATVNATFTLVNYPNAKWADGQTGATRTVTWTVTAHELSPNETASLFCKTHTLTYNGDPYNWYEYSGDFESKTELQTATSTSNPTYFKTVAGTTFAKNAGNYTVSLTPANWAYWHHDQSGAPRDTRSRPWQIQKANYPIVLSQDSVTLNDDNLSATVDVAAPTGKGLPTGAVTVTSNDTQIATVSYNSSNDVITINAGLPGTTSILVSRAADTNYNAAAAKTITVTVSRSLNSLSWTQISNLAKNGTLSNYAKVGDWKNVNVNGTVGTVNINGTYRAVLIGINHNSGVEGNNRAHFSIMHNGQYSNAFIDGKYNQTTDDTSYFIGTDLWSANTPLTKYCNAFYNCLPAELQNVIVACKKYYLSVGHQNYRTDKIWSLSAIELFGNSAQPLTSTVIKQYDYWANGNSKTAWAYLDGQLPTVNYWTRDSAETTRYAVDKSGHLVSAAQNLSYGLRPCFTVGGE